MAGAARSIDRLLRRSGTPGVDALRALSKAACWLSETRQALERRAVVDAAFGLAEAARSLGTVACDLARSSPDLAEAALELSSAARRLADAAHALSAAQTRAPVEAPRRPHRSLNDR